MSQIKRGALLSFLNIGITNVVGLILTPFIIKTLGDSEYGLYSLIGSLIAYFTLIDFGLGDTVVRFVARYRAQDDKQEESYFLGTALKVYLVITTFLLILGVIMYLNLENLFSKSLSFAEMSKAKTMFIFLLFNLMISLPGNIFLGISNAYEKYTYTKGILILKYVLRSLTVFLVLYNGGGVISIVIIDTIFNILFILSNIYYSFLKVKIEIKFRKLNLEEVKVILSFSIWMFLLSLVSQMQWQGGQVIIGVLGNTKQVAVYAVGIVLGTYYGAFSSAISSLFLPRATKMLIDGTNIVDLSNMMIKIGRISLIILLFILGGFILVGKDFVYLWVGKEYEESYYIALILMLVYTIPLTQTFANSLMEAKSKVYYKAIIYTIAISTGTILSYIVYPYFGNIGVVTVICSTWLVGILILNYFYYKVLSIDIIKFYIQLSKGVLLLLVLILLFKYTFSFYPQQSWLALILKGLAFSLTYFVAFYYLYFNSEEKSLLPFDRIK